MRKVAIIVIVLCSVVNLACASMPSQRIDQYDELNRITIVPIASVVPGFDNGWQIWATDYQINVEDRYVKFFCPCYSRYDWVARAPIDRDGRPGRVGDKEVTIFFATRLAFRIMVEKPGMRMQEYKIERVYD